MPEPEVGRRAVELDAAFAAVVASAEGLIRGDSADKDRCLEEIFVLNNVIGRLAREHPRMMRQLKELQGCVNLITVGVKNAKAEDIRAGIALTRESIDSLKGGFPLGS
ncbi:MAG: hypothetical protein OK455_05340 [Thaumarchaeota archaeon]|nr:hypothetical protein [Nitrososphaerota archaeon]